MTRAALRRSVALLAVVGASPALGQTVRDSAGITIVENPAPNRSIVALRVSPAPLFTIGVDSLASPGRHPLLGLMRLPGGRFIAADPMSKALRYFDSAGHPVQVVDPTSGVGNPQAQLLKRARGDSVITATGMNSMYWLWDGTGKRVRDALPGLATFDVQDSGLLPSLLGVFDDGTYAMFTGVPPKVAGTLTWRPMGDVPDPRTRFLCLHVSADGMRLLDTIGVFPSSDRTPTYVFSRGVNGTANSTTLPIPGLRQSSMSVEGDRLLWAEGTTYELRAFAANGKLMRIIRAAAPPRPFTDADIAAVKADVLKRLTGEALVTATEGLAKVVFPASHAAFGRVLVDDARRIWVQAAPAPGEDPYWALFDRDGRLLGTVAIAADQRIAWIGADQIAFSKSDPRGIVFVVHQLLSGR
jgi:hypothetical protein